MQLRPDFYLQTEMGESMEQTKHSTDLKTMPVVWIYTSYSTKGENLRQIELGLEEEGIPCKVHEVKSESAHDMAIQAAKASSLGVGLSLVESACQAVLHHRDLPDDEKLIEITGEAFNNNTLRRLGANSARFVKGTPLVPIIENDVDDVIRPSSDQSGAMDSLSSQYDGIDIETLVRIVVEIIKKFNFEKVGS